MTAIRLPQAFSVGRALASFALAAALILPLGVAARADDDSAATADYRIGSQDKLDITVFGVKDLTVDKIEVDASGQILLPLIGAVTAKGKTTTELSNEIADRLREHYMQSPQVSVSIDEAVSQKVTVEGAVNDAGVFPMKGRTSLLEAVAMAKGVSSNGDLHHVAIIRSVDGAPKAAVFDVEAIQRGKAKNPEVLGNDIIVVDDSGAKLFWHGLIKTLPALIVFSYF
ncbi:MAG: polysaccharide biosynthesis/export family protein [Caulobacterales bacterium]